MLRPDAQPIHVQTCKIPSRVVRWCHLWSAYDNYSRGSLSGSIKIYDLRVQGAGGVVWKFKRGHEGAIRDLRWSPFIPYWFATCGEDACVKVWDVRYAKSAVLELMDHSNSVNSVCSTYSKHYNLLSLTRNSSQ